MTTRDILLVGHIGFAVVALGPVTLAVSTFPRHAARARSDPGALGAARLLHRVSRAYGSMAAAVPLLGMFLAADSGYMSHVWVHASLGLTAVGAAVLVLGVIPDQRRVLDAADPPPPEGRLHGLPGLFSLSWVAILVLMVVKPA